MAKSLFKLLPVKNFRRNRVKACANCKHMHTDDYIEYRCRRPLRGKAGARPVWHFTAWSDPFAEMWQCVCDRWTKKQTN